VLLQAMRRRHLGGLRGAAIPLRRSSGAMRTPRADLTRRSGDRSRAGIGVALELYLPEFD